MNQLSSIGRPIDPNYPTNRAIALLTIAAMVVGAHVRLLSGNAWGDSALWGAQAGLVIFLAWALCRELDPDRAMAAFVAAGLAMVGLFLWELPRLGVIFWLLLTMRVVNRTTGLPATVLDALIVLGVGSWLSTPGNLGYVAITALVFLLDGALAPRSRRSFVFAGLGLVITGLIVVLGNPAWGGGPSLTGALIGVGLSALFAPVMYATRHVESVGDNTGERLNSTRVQVAQGLALLVGVETGFWGGTAGLVALAPLWAAVLGAAVYWTYTVIRR